MTLDVGRLFLGMNLHCAQCHDHPNVKDYRQSHYFGIYAYLQHSKLYRDKSKRTFFIETVAKSKAEFQSVFTREKGQTGPRLPEGMEIAVPTFAKGEEFAVAPKDGKPGIPKFRPRQLLAKDLTAATNRRFARNSVNRFWFAMMDRAW